MKNTVSGQNTTSDWLVWKVECKLSKPRKTFQKWTHLRFSNKLLFDPINRVAREPIRKLGKENRIVLALRVAQWNKEQPNNIATGVKAALNFYSKQDVESIYLQRLRKKFDDDEVLEMISGIERTDPLNSFCLEQSLNI